MAREALAATRNKGDTVMTIARLRQLAKIHWGLGEYVVALQHLSEAQTLGERHLPETNPLYYNVLLDISVQRHALRDFEGALQASGRAYDLARRATAPGSNDWTGCLLTHLASLEALGRRDEMRVVLADAHQSLVAGRGPDHALARDLEARIKRLDDG